MKKILLVAVISDIHFGALPARELYEQLIENFIKPLYKLPKLDLIVIDGDTANHKLGLDSEHSKYLSKFINKDIKKLAKKKKCAVRWVQGTLSHDNNQLDNFMHLEESSIDLKIIKTVREEDFHGFKMLYIPEEYMSDYKDYYRKYFNKSNRYDFVFGHGMFQEVAFSGAKTEIQMKKAPIFKSNDIINICKGPIIFGHIHDYTVIKDQIYYPGSFSRWCMGEEKKKGSVIALYNKETEKYLVSRLYNDDAPKYITMNITHYLHLPFDIIKNAIEVTMDETNIHKLRLNIKYTGNNKTILTNIRLVKEYYKDNKKIVVNIKNNLTLKDKTSKKLVLKYDYIFNKGESIENKISRFIGEEYDYKISPETVRDILFENIV